jgi:hypothetical protein
MIDDSYEMILSRDQENALSIDLCITERDEMKATSHKLHERSENSNSNQSKDHHMIN